MKKLFYFIAAGILAGSVVSCDNEPKNPGNFDIKAELKVVDFIADQTGVVYPVEIEQVIDSIFLDRVAVKDTTYDADGNQVITTDSVTVKRNHITKFYVAKQIVLPPEADTYTINIESNAKWVAPAAVRQGGANYFQNDGVLAGGGDGNLNYHTLDATTVVNRPNPFTLNVFTSDTTVWYRIPVTQLGGKQ